MKKNTLTLIIGALLILLFAVLLFVYQVRTTQVAVVTTFGRPTLDVTNAGAYVKWPWPVQKVYYFDKRVQNFEDKLSEGITSDSINLITTVYVGWRITDPKTFFPKFPGGSVIEAQKRLEGVLRTYEKAVLGKHPMSDFVSATDNGAKLSAIEKEIFDAVQTQLRESNYGLEIEFLGIKKLELPESVTQSVFERMTSERKVLTDNLQAEGERDAANIRSDADRKAAEMLFAADAQATRIRGEAEAKAAESLEGFKQRSEERRVG